ncbi:hypothetical protein EWM64_g5910 [Hericium alpestre]|uniref:Uncharacterized protein n=1 Tax=Hericium alpestre TaxID=135208 RepID=A0A4Y9ZVB4_9AGAM|nr:hypothetical protein EWM64_g5910 [Hericium alpestre]
MKREQDQLEKKLWEERQAIKKKHEEKVKVAKTKASMVGAGGLSKHEADMFSDAVRKELQKFDAERAVPAWDGLVAKQQAVLEALAVPTMFVTSSTSDVEKQQRVMQVLQNVVSS